MDINEKIAKVCLRWKKKPEVFAKELLGFDLSDQQLPIFLDGIDYESRVIVKSCTGSGKTFVLAVIILHQLLTQEEVGIMAVSPSAAQLKAGLIKEVRKLISMIKIPEFQELFEMQQDNIHRVNLRGTHYCFFRSGDPGNVENLSGFHAKKTIIMVDEASAIGEAAMNALLGNLTEAGSSLIQTSNPSRSSGPFFKVFQDKPSGYSLYTLDAYGCPRISRKWIAELIESYGEDSDIVRVRIKGLFPRSSSSLFIPGDIIEGAIGRNLNPLDYRNFPIIMGVDVARFGDDKSVIVLRQGAKLVDIQLYRELDTMELAAIVQDKYRSSGKIASIVIDAVGVGAGVADRLKQLQLPVIEFNAGSKSTNSRAYFNLRAEMYDLTKEWLRSADIPLLQDLEDELRSIHYGYNLRAQLQLMTKKDMKKLGFHSPDIVDAITFTFFTQTQMGAMIRRRPRGVRKVNAWVT